MLSKNPDTGLKRIISACRYALAGLKAAIEHEASFRQEIYLLCVAIPLVLWLEAEPLPRA